MRRHGRRVAKVHDHVFALFNQRRKLGFQLWAGRPIDVALRSNDDDVVACLFVQFHMLTQPNPQVPAFSFERLSDAAIIDSSLNSHADAKSYDVSTIRLVISDITQQMTHDKKAHTTFTLSRKRFIQ